MPVVFNSMKPKDHQLVTSRGRIDTRYLVPVAAVSYSYVVPVFLRNNTKITINNIQLPTNSSYKTYTFLELIFIYFQDAIQ
jgi:dipeptidase